MNKTGQAAVFLDTITKIMAAEQGITYSEAFSRAQIAHPEVTKMYIMEIEEGEIE